MWASAIALLSAAATQSVTVPPLTGPVVDRAGLLSPMEAERIAAGLERYQRQSTNQLQLLIVPSLPEGVPMEEYSIRVAEEWKLGTAEQDNGVLVVVSVQDRKWRIEVGGGLEGDLTDVAASRIGREILVPAFQRGEYASGIAGTFQAIAGSLGGAIDFQGLPQQVRRTTRDRPVGSVLPLIIFALFILLAGRGRRGILAGLLLGHMMGRGGGWGGGRGGGGGWGGGGGGFSGGGAGGGW